MQIERDCQIGDPDFDIFENDENLGKIVKNYSFSPNFQFFFEFSKTGIYVKEYLLMNMRAKFHVATWKMTYFAVLNAPKVTFDAIYEDSGTFIRFSNFCSIWAVQKVFWGLFAFLTKILPKTCTTRPKIKILNLYFLAS